MPGDVSVWPNLSGGESIDFLARLRGARTKDAAYRAERERLMEAFQFDPRKKGRAYSKGNRQKVALIAAFAVPADLYILDEPTSGLDPLMEVVFRDEIAASARGRARPCCCPATSCPRSSCSAIASASSAPGGSWSRARSPNCATSPAPRCRSRRRTPPCSPGSREAHDGAISEGRARFTIDSDAVPSVLPVLAQRSVTGPRIEPPSLEELFLRHYGDDLAGLRDAEAGDSAGSATGTRAARRAMAKESR